MTMTMNELLAKVSQLEAEQEASPLTRKPTASGNGEPSKTVTRSTSRTRTVVKKPAKQAKANIAIPAEASHRDAMELVRDDSNSLTEEDYFLWVDKTAKTRSSKKTNGRPDFEFEVAENGVISLWGDDIYVSSRRKMKLPAQSLVALLAHRMVDLVDQIDAEISDNDIVVESRAGKNGDYEVTKCGTVLLRTGKEEEFMTDLAKAKSMCASLREAGYFTS